MTDTRDCPGPGPPGKQTAPVVWLAVGDRPIVSADGRHMTGFVAPGDGSRWDWNFVALRGP